jgi:hypothetical protein
MSTLVTREVSAVGVGECDTANPEKVLRVVERARRLGRGDPVSPPESQLRLAGGGDLLGDEAQCGNGAGRAVRGCEPGLELPAQAHGDLVAAQGVDLCSPCAPQRRPIDTESLDIEEGAELAPCRELLGELLCQGMDRDGGLGDPFEWGLEGLLDLEGRAGLVAGRMDDLCSAGQRVGAYPVGPEAGGDELEREFGELPECREAASV